MQINEHDSAHRQWKRQKPHDHLHRCISYNSISIHHKHYSQSGYGGNISQHNKIYTGPTHSKHNTQWWQADSLPTKIQKTKGSLLAPILFNMGLEVLLRIVRQETEMKGIQIGSKEVQLSWQPGNLILYRGHPKDVTHQLQATVNKFIRVTGYKIDIQKSAAFLHTNNQILERENKAKQTINLFKIIPKKQNKIRETKPDLGVTDLHAYNYNTLWRQLKMIQRNG